jgi:ABC-type uncharacterized transport system auxiliary subunit
VLAYLQDDRVQRWPRVFQVSADVRDGDPAEALADALGRALNAVVTQVAEQTITSLPKAASAPAAALLPAPHEPARAAVP